MKTAEEILKELTLEEKARLCQGASFWFTTDIPERGIPGIMVSDGPHGLRKQTGEADHLGINKSIPSTCFPSSAAVCNSWDEELIYRIGVALGEECQQENIAVLLGPGANIKRSPLCGRNFEYFSEDPFLSSHMAKSHILGVQSQGVGTSLKHFAVNNQETCRMTVDAVVDERTLREIYLASFEAAVREGKPWTIMGAYNRLNGQYCCENHHLLKEILREEWGYPGSGIYRDVWLWQGSTTHFLPEKQHITTESVEEDYAVLLLEGSVHNASGQAKKLRLEAQILDNEGASVASAVSSVPVLAGSDAGWHSRITVEKPVLWFVETPNLYSCVLKLYDGAQLLDEQLETFGIRTLKLDARKGLRINGQTVKLRGACIHHDNGIIGAATYYDAELFRLKKLKEAGFNALRSAHNPMSKAMLRACDELGMLVMDEFTDMWNEPKNAGDWSHDFGRSWEKELQRLVDKDYNHPCVIMYSTGNELPEIGRVSGADQNRRIAEAIRKLDPSRYSTVGISGILAVVDDLPLFAAAMEQQAQPMETTGGSEEMNSMMGSAEQQMLDTFSVSDLLTNRLEAVESAVDVVGYGVSGVARCIRIVRFFPKKGSISMKIVKAGTNPEPTQFELNNRALARKAAAEGFVLLENDGILPLKGKKVAIYGSGARMTVKGGTGSGQVRERYSVNIAQGMENAGFEITSKAWLDRFDKFYADTYEAYRLEQEEKVKGIREFGKILHMVSPFQHPTGIPVTEEDVASSECDTAIYVLARQAGEGNDRYDQQGDYRLDDVERENLEFVSKNYQNFIVVVNAGGVIDVSFLDTLHVSALVYYVQGGEEGGNALADVLSGKVNFSGKLATSWAYRFEDIPSNTTYSYLAPDKHNQEYNEGIYVGYRYFDTFGVKPRYAFGYGLSYTTFDIAYVSATAEMGAVTARAAVTNTGSVAGKEVVQLYASVPFGDGAEKQRLVAFAKTKELAPGETQEVTLTVSLRDLSCYDEAKAAWVLRGGEYVLRLGNASNRNEAVAVLALEKEAILEQCTNVCPVEHAIDEIKAPARAQEDISGLPTLSLEGFIPETIVHTYETPEEAPDALVESMTDEQLITLVIGGGTSNKGLVVEAMGASGTTTPDLYAELGIPNVILSDGPAGLNLTPQVAEMGDDVTKPVKTPQMLEAYRRYLFGFTRMIMLKQMAEPGEGITHYQYATAWPCGQLLAQTFDPELLEQVGDGVGTEMEAYGVTVWLAPGMNIHRNPLCGRTFEYYSEDPYVSGKMAAAIVRGVQSHPGKGMSIKHFAANNCELVRNFSSSNVSERALREIYLRGFEIAVKESSPMTVMAAYNKINGVYCTNNYDLLVKVLRNEWGFEGLVMSDWDSMKATSDPMVPLSGDVLKAHMAQCDLVSPGRPDQREALKKGLETGAVKREDVKRSAVRMLKMIRSNTVLESK